MNLVNGKVYVGVTNGNDPRYLGSGKLLHEAIKKYGREQFKRETIAVFETADDAYAIEEAVVDAEFISRSDTYNIQIGGMGGRNGRPAGWKMTDEHKAKISAYHTGRVDSVETRQKNSESVAEHWASMSDEDRIARSIAMSAGIDSEKRSAQNRKMWANRSAADKKRILDAAHAGNMKALIYKGMHFESRKALAEYLGISYQCLKARLHRGQIEVEDV